MLHLTKGMDAYGKKQREQALLKRNKEKELRSERNSRELRGGVSKKGKKIELFVRGFIGCMAETR